MPKVEVEKQFKVSKKHLQNILQSYGLKFLSFQLPPGGIENKTVIVTTDKGKYVLRIFRKKKKSTWWIGQEIAFMEYLKKNKLPVPKVLSNNLGQQVTIYKENGHSWQCILMEFMPGKHNRGYNSEMIKDFARIQARLHELGISYARAKKYKFHGLHAKFLFSELLKKDYKRKEIVEFLTRASHLKVVFPKNFPMGLNHMDFDHANVLVKGNKISGILDFDDLAYGPAVTCLGITLFDVLYMTGKMTFVIEYLQIYKKFRKVSNAELQALINIMIFRNYTVGAFELMFWGEKAKHIGPILSYEKLLQSLDPDYFIKVLS